MGRICDIGIAADRLIGFIRDFVSGSGYDKLVVGLSGGVDSSLSAALGVRAIGSRNVLGLILPYKSSSPEAEQDALKMADMIGIKTEKIDISPMVDAYFGDTEVPVIRKGNKMARERMAILFDIASRDSRLVLGTSNKTEICLGYSTWYGDAACSLNPLGGLYKGEVRRMASLMKVPEHITDKIPSADLWAGQTDEGELGISYEMADRVLYAVVEEGERKMAKLLETGADETTIRSIIARLNKYAFKRSQPATDLLGGEAIPSGVNIL